MSAGVILVFVLSAAVCGLSIACFRLRRALRAERESASDLRWRISRSDDYDLHSEWTP